jgi:hypothetical protein
MRLALHLAKVSGETWRSSHVSLVVSHLVAVRVVVTAGTSGEVPAHGIRMARNGGPSLE